MTTNKKIKFIESEEGIKVKRILRSMMDDKSYNTSPCYSANKDLYPNNLMSFVDKHMQYLNAHPNIDPKQYIANLRLITSIK
ncbi:hypothetical protein DYH10_00465 [Candidatus Saccharibacteria bacterium CPR2]|nr:hypothetical protein [Candidatus Saccharibacteria bacterium CPR2]